jgi:hypothetical protein
LKNRAPESLTWLYDPDSGLQGRFDGDLHAVSEFRNKLHHFLQGKERKASPAEGGDPRLIDSQNVRSLGLSEFALCDDLIDPPCDLGLGQGGVRVWNSYVGENVPGAWLAFDFAFHGFLDAL